MCHSDSFLAPWDSIQWLLSITASGQSLGLVLELPTISFIPFQAISFSPYYEILELTPSSSGKLWTSAFIGLKRKEGVHPFTSKCSQTIPGHFVFSRNSLLTSLFSSKTSLHLGIPQNTSLLFAEPRSLLFSLQTSKFDILKFSFSILAQLIHSFLVILI